MTDTVGKTLFVVGFIVASSWIFAHSLSPGTQRGWRAIGWVSLAFMFVGLILIGVMS